jgi:hypothetical protein
MIRSPKMCFPYQPTGRHQFKTFVLFLTGEA